LHFSTDYPFTSAGNASNYLTADSVFRDSGIEDDGLLADLAASTTYAPQDGSWPDIYGTDLGYHYPINTHDDSLGTNFWLTFFFMERYNTNGLSLYISSPVGASGMVTIPGLHVTNTFTVAAGAVTNISIPFAAMLMDGEVMETNGIHVTASAPVSVYGLRYVVQGSAAFTAYPTPLLGTNYCVMARPSFRPADEYGDVLNSQFAIVATADGTTVTITPSATAELEGQTNVYYTETLQQGQTYQINSSDPTNDVTGTMVTSDKPIGVFAGASSVDVPDGDTAAANPLVQEQLPVDSWGIQALSMGFAGRTNGDSYRVLAAYDNTVITITGLVITVVDETVNPYIVTSSNETVVVTNQAGQFYDLIVEGPVQFQASQPIQVAHFANGDDFDDVPDGDPCEILLLTTGHYLETNIVVTLPNDDVTGDFPENYLNLIAPQSAITNTVVDGSVVAATNFTAIGNSGYCGAQITITNSGAHKITSSQPVGIEVYGWGYVDAYGYFGGMVK
jgi:hypothetical protein